VAVIGFVEVLLRLLTAAVLGAVIGVNRGRLEWAAGLRTHMLVSVGAALAVIVSAYGFQHALTYDHVVLDPSRIAAQVISGIGFLGAGTILFLQKEQVIRGLTTAAGLWAVAAVGLAAGTGLYVPAITATLILWVILALLKPLERRFVKPRRQHTSLVIELSTGSTLSSVERVLNHFHAPVRYMILRRQQDGHDTLDVRFASAIAFDKLTEMADACRAIEGAGTITISAPARSRD
jgi:putative Mg2+ transporter-C (MgtC) family protein